MILSHSTDRMSGMHQHRGRTPICGAALSTNYVKCGDNI